MNAPLLPFAPRRTSQRLRLRPFELADVPGVQGLLARHGQSARSAAGLKWALLDNPARALAGADAGWVLENDAGIVGFLGNLPSQHLDNGQMIVLASCTTPVVDDAIRAHAIRLMRAFATQPGMGLLAVTPESATLANAFSSLGFECPGRASTRQRLLWRVGRGSWLTPAHVGLGKGARVRVPRWTHRWTGIDGQEVLTSGQAGLQVRRITADELVGTCPGPWPTAWNAWATRFWSRPGLWPERSAYHLSWRLSDPDLAGQLALWGVLDGSGNLVGMALARTLANADMVGISSPRAELMDWAVLPQAAGAAAEPLLRAVLAWAGSQGAGSLIADALSGEASQQLETLAPKRTQTPHEPCRVLDTRPSRAPSAIEPDPIRPDVESAALPGSRWFYTGLVEATASAPTWHPARAPHRVLTPAAETAVVDITSPVSAFQ